MSKSKAEKKNSTFKITGIIIGAVIVILVAISIGHLQSKSSLKSQLEQYNVLLFDTPRLLPDVTLVRHDEQRFSVEQFLGHWDLVNFGYTYCPDICPTNLADMNIAYHQLSDLNLIDNLQFWMFSVDPSRDTPQQLAQYVPFFNKAFIGVTGDPEEIATLATQLSAVYYQEGEGEGYTVAHSDNYAVIDPQGNFVALMRPPHKPSDISHSLALIMGASK